MRPRALSWPLALLLGGLLALAARVEVSLAAPKQKAPTAGVALSPLSSSTIFIIRHAEKPDYGPGLSARGEERAQAYARFFRNLSTDSDSARLDYLVAAADSKKSLRPRLTLEPLSEAIGAKIVLDYDQSQSADLAAFLKSERRGSAILICWRHAEIPDLLRALGANPAKLLPGGKWPDDEYGWVLRLRFDTAGKLISKKSRRFTPDLGPGFDGSASERPAK
jgi:hypothetical protein